jgi:hypothetical protein
MKRTIALTAVLFIVGLAGAQDISDAENAQSFKPLFDGKSFAGWKTTDRRRPAGRSTAACWC